MDKVMPLQEKVLASDLYFKYGLELMLKAMLESVEKVTAHWAEHPTEYTPPPFVRSITRDETLLRQALDMLYETEPL
jgi:hypothetical protein